jgi:hypothetical protein
LKTPEGWARANLLLHTLQAPPQKGSLQESALILLLIQQEAIEHARFRALAQIIVDQEKGVEAFEEYMKIAFPYLTSAKRREKQQYIELLKKEAMRGPIGVTPVTMPSVNSRMKKKLMTPAKRAETNSLYQKLGDTIPLR